MAHKGKVTATEVSMLFGGKSKKINCVTNSWAKKGAIAN
jgi:hypothetical protein